MSPSRFDTNIARHIVHKTQRWAIHLAELNYTIEHIPGEINLWDDMLTHWVSADNARFPARRISTIRAPLIIEDLPDLPSVKAIAYCQQNSPPSEASDFSLVQIDGLDMWANSSGLFYIPPNDTAMQLRICVAAHCGLGGHRAKTATKSTVKEKVYWPTMDTDIDSFFESCLSVYCLRRVKRFHDRSDSRKTHT